ncbi:3-phosphoshikimate 1-carboxyvinyltransferase [Planctomycetales bacterium ZRK34]|nr:3-phosphoshikimate 1-carboxyvinyltransferase [Planctomycetales bacterium ZRK34]
MPDQQPITPVDRFELTIDDLPGSKSLTNRALLLAALARGVSELTNVLFADDTRVMMAALGKLGFQLQVDEPKRSVVVHGLGGKIPAKDAELILGNAGTAMRFLTAACCLGHGTYTLDGIPRMRQRPIGQLVDPLRSLGAKIDYLGEDGFPPLEIHADGLAGDGGSVHMSPTTSSQFVSALMQIAPCCLRDIELVFDDRPVSIPYIEMTAKLMELFGAETDCDRDWTRVSVPGSQTYEAMDYRIEPDASNASYFLAAAAITPMSAVRITGLGRGSVQGDAAFAHVLSRMGVTVEQRDAQTWLKGPRSLRNIDIDLNAMPDMAQTLAIVTLFAEGPSVIRNIGNLRVKETDRLAALHAELTKLGATVRIDGDDLHITPPPGGQLTPAAIDTYDDHRMAMAFAVAGLRSPGVVINDPACVNKTFPEYFDYLKRLSSASAV